MFRSVPCLVISLIMMCPLAAQSPRDPAPHSSTGGLSVDPRRPWTWDSLETRLAEAAQKGFEGAILVVRDGSVVLHKAYGLANREQDIPLRPDTVFAIGSAPIDFTRAGILLLVDEAKLRLDDPITRFFEEVPADKQQITIKDLMTGRSGLPDFHDLPSDENKDHTWIDRAEAVRRILSQDLLFPPGTAEEHSHSAWVLLAAVIEVTSGQSYPEFTRKRLFQPAGMADTGFFGDPVPEDRVAVGYGWHKSSEPNSPPHWGPTSWLVMGSGGQVSTLGDMLRWTTTVRSGRLLSPGSTEQYIRSTSGMSSDGDMFGFEFMHSHDPQSLFMLISNSIDSDEKLDQFRSLGRSLALLTRAAAGGHRYSLGVAMAVTSDDTVTVQQLAPGGAAERGGLQVGDQLLAANGRQFGSQPMEILEPLLEDGGLIKFKVQRDGRELIISVQPERRVAE